MMLKTFRSATVPSSPASGLFLRCSGSCSRRPAAARLALDDPLQRRVGHQTSVPIMLAFDFNRGKTGGKCAACHHVLRLDRVCRRIEVDEISRPDVDRTHAKAEQAGVEAVEIDQALQCTLKLTRVVEAGCLERPPWLQPWRARPGREEAVGPLHKRQVRAELIQQVARAVAFCRCPAEPMPRRIRSHLGPELPKSITPRVRRIAGDDGRVNASNRNAGNPIRFYKGFGQGFVHPGLIRTERTTALQYQGHALERPN